MRCQTRTHYRGQEREFKEISLTLPLDRLGTFYNSAPGAHSKDQVEAWASKAHPDIWAELLKVGKMTPDMRGSRVRKGVEDEEDEEGEEEEEEEEEQMREQMLRVMKGVCFNIERAVEA